MTLIQTHTHANLFVYLRIMIITECGSTPYLGITMEFLNNWVFDHGILQASKLALFTVIA